METVRYVLREIRTQILFGVQAVRAGYLMSAFLWLCVGLLRAPPEDETKQSLNTDIYILF